MARKRKPRHPAATVKARRPTKALKPLHGTFKGKKSWAGVSL